MEESTREVGGRTIELSNLDKVLFPEAGVTKGDLVDYYERIAPVMLPHVAGRFISMERWPDGLAGDGFYQKEAPDHFPDWIHTGRVETQEGANRQVIVDEAATLVYLAQQACVTPHVWLSRADAPRRPDRLVFDFDPSRPWEQAFDEIRRAARLMRDLLADLGMESRVMLSGSRGLHVHVTLDASSAFEEAKAFSRDVAGLLARRHPDRLTVQHRKKKRGGRIFIDYLRNDYAQTAVAPYAVRARGGAPVAAPLDWEELSDAGMGPRRYTVKDVFRRLDAKDDPWSDADGATADLGEARRRLDGLLEEVGT